MIWTGERPLAKALGFEEVVQVVDQAATFVEFFKIDFGDDCVEMLQ